jgi:Leucine-rich repeat (LRR) protein
MNSRAFPNVLIVLLSIFLAACSESEEPEWKLKELQRKERTQTLVGALARRTPEERNAAFVELRDTLVRRRDIPELIKEIDRNPSPEVKRSLQDLISLAKSGSRLPTGGWTREDTSEAYKRGFQNLGCSAMRESIMGYPTICISDALHIFDLPSEAKKLAVVVGLILDLEPSGLTLSWEKWTNISFLGALPDIKGLNLFFTSVDDLTPLRGLNRLSLLELVDSPVSDLTPLKGLPSLRVLKLLNTEVTDLTALKDLTSLTELHLESAEVIDLTPLKELPRLRHLYLQGPGGNDLTPLKEMADLNVSVRETKQGDSKPNRK